MFIRNEEEIKTFSDKGKLLKGFIMNTSTLKGWLKEILWTERKQ